MIPRVLRAVVALNVSADEALLPTASWPEGAHDTEVLTDASQMALARGSAVVRTQAAEGSSDAPAAPVVLACPLLYQGHMLGVAAVEVEALEDQQQRAVLQLLEWGAAWLGFLLEGDSPAAVATRLATVVETAATGLEHPRFQAAATAAATRLARSVSCERVSIGFLERQRIRVCALSDTANLDRRANLVRDIEAAMDEALDEGHALVHPPLPAAPPQGTGAQERLARRHATAAVCTVPLGSARGVVGALTFERAHDAPFDQATVHLCDAVAGLLGPILELKRREDRWIGAKIADSLSGLLGGLLGPRHLRRKLAAIALLTLIALLGFATAEYRISSSAVVEGNVQRALVAPFDGYLLSESARAGDVVKRGAVLAELDDRALRLEQRRRLSERDELVNQHRRAVAKLDLAQAGILEAQIGRAEAQLALTEEQLSHTQVVAPFEGMIVSGDLSHSRGAPLERGEVLFEIAPLDGFRIALDVDEADIDGVAKGQRGQLALAAIPGERLAFTVEQITTVARSEDGRNVFRVEARVDDATPFLRPGMRGVGKISVERRSLIWVWTHDLLQRIQLWLWSTLP